MKYSVSLPTASPVSRDSVQNVIDCTTPTLRGPTTVEQLSHHHHPKRRIVTGQDHIQDPEFKIIKLKNSVKKGQKSDIKVILTHFHFHLDFSHVGLTQIHVYMIL